MFAWSDLGGEKMLDLIVFSVSLPLFSPPNWRENGEENRLVGPPIFFLFFFFLSFYGLFVKFLTCLFYSKINPFFFFYIKKFLCNRGMRLNLYKFYFLSPNLSFSNQTQIRRTKISSIFPLFHHLSHFLSSYFSISNQTNLMC